MVSSWFALMVRLSVEHCFFHLHIGHVFVLLTSEPGRQGLALVDAHLDLPHSLLLLQLQLAQLQLHAVDGLLHAACEGLHAVRVVARPPLALGLAHQQEASDHRRQHAKLEGHHSNHLLKNESGKSHCSSLIGSGHIGITILNDVTGV